MTRFNNSKSLRQEAVPPLDVDALTERLRALASELEQTRKHAAHLQEQLLIAKSDNDFSRATRRAALNLLEDAIASRQAEQLQALERQRAETAFRQSEARFQTLFESMNEACCIVEEVHSPDDTTDFLFVDSNSAFEEHTGKTDVVGRSMSQIEDAGFADLADICREVVDSGQSLEGERQLFAQDRHYVISACKIKAEVQQRVALLLTDITERKRTAALAANEQRLRALSVEIAKAEFRERRRIAGVLHEDVQQLLIAMQLRAGMIQSETTEPAVNEQVSILNELLVDSINTVRALSRDLVPPTLYQLGLAAGLEWLASRFQQQHGLRVEVVAAEDAAFYSNVLRDLIFSIARELLLNVIKHAHTDRTRISLQRQAAHLCLTVKDEGIGADVQCLLQRRDSFGLFQIRERLHAIGGQLQLNGSPGEGLQVVALIPVDFDDRTAQ